MQFAPDPMRLIFWLLLGGFVLATGIAAIIPEPVPIRSRAWRRSLRPSLAVPGSLRVAFMAAIPCLTATWALGGLILSLAPSLTASVLGSGLRGGVPRSVQPCARRSARRAGSSIFAVAYLAFSLPAVAAGAAVSSLSLRDTAYIYGAALIVLASIALALSHQLQDPQSVRAATPVAT